MKEFPLDVNTDKENGLVFLQASILNLISMFTFNNKKRLQKRFRIQGEKQK